MNVSLPDLSPGLLLAGAVTAAAASLWLLLPRGAESRVARSLGLILGATALAGFIATGRRLGGIGEEAVFLVVSLVAVISGAATVVSRSPVYAAIWFALALAGVAGVLLVAAPLSVGGVLLLAPLVTQLGVPVLAHGKMFRFTPAGADNRPGRAVTVAVRVDGDMDIRVVGARNSFALPATAASAPGAAPVRAAGRAARWRPSRRRRTRRTLEP